MEIQRLTQDNNQLRAENAELKKQNQKLMEALKRAAYETNVSTNKCKYTLSGEPCPHVDGE